MLDVARNSMSKNAFTKCDNGDVGHFLSADYLKYFAASNGTVRSR